MRRYGRTRAASPARGCLCLRRRLYAAAASAIGFSFRMGSSPQSSPDRHPESAARGVAARKEVLRLLHSVLSEGRTLFESNESLGHLSPSQRAWAQRMAESTLRHLGRADAVLGEFLAKRPRPLPLNALRLAVVEMHAENIPPHAAIDQAVRVLRSKASTSHWAGMANGVLRNVAKKGGKAWQASGPQRLPPWIADPVRNAWGEKALAAIEEAHERRPPLDLTVKQSASAGAVAERMGGALLPTGSVRLPRAGKISELPGYAEGDWWVQDAAAAVPVRLLGDLEGATVADLCAAPGGKALQCASAGARVIAVDSSPMRMERLRRNFDRIGLSGTFICADSRHWDPDRQFDAAIVDAPCSATGTIRRNPDVAHRAVRSPDHAKLAGLQWQLLRRAHALVGSGGRILYCVCSLIPDEGEDVARRFISEFGTRAVPIVHARIGIDGAWTTGEGGLRLRPDYWPEIGGMDGFYAIAFEKP